MTRGFLRHLVRYWSLENCRFQRCFILLGKLGGFGSFFNYISRLDHSWFVYFHLLKFSSQYHLDLFIALIQHQDILGGILPNPGCPIVMEDDPRALLASALPSTVTAETQIKAYPFKII